jgi:hypothetical protein
MKLNITVKKNIVPLIVLKRRLAMLANTKTEVGFFADKKYGPENDNLPVAQVAWWQEQGTFSKSTGSAHIPARPFFLTTMHVLTKGLPAKNLTKRMAWAAEMFLFKRMSPIPAMENAGEVVKEQLQGAIDRWSHPRNADSTIAQKGFNNPLIETGFMKDSVAFRVVKRK